MNFARDVVEAADPRALAVVELGRTGGRREWTFADVARAARTLAAAPARAGRAPRRRRADARGQRARLGGGDGRLLPPGLRRAALHRAAARRRPAPAPRRRAPAPPSSRTGATRPSCATPGWDRADDLGPGRRRLARARAAAGARARPRGPVPDHVHQRHLGRAEGRRARPALPDRPAACRPSTGSTPRPGELVWCTAASGWSKSARNAFIAPWIRGAAALLHDARFDPAERLEILARERVNVLCMAPTEYRVIAKRAEVRPVAGLRGLVAAGEALNPEVLRAWHEATGPGSATATARPRPGRSPACRSASTRVARARWAARCRACRLWVDDGELVARPDHAADVLPRLHRRGARRRAIARGAPATA